MTALPLDPRGRAQAQAQGAGAADAQRAAAAAVAQAREALAQAGRERARAVELAAPGLASPEERERAELAETLAARDLEAAEFRAQAAQHDVEAARAALIAGLLCLACAFTIILRKTTKQQQTRNNMPLPLKRCSVRRHGIEAWKPLQKAMAGTVYGQRLGYEIQEIEAAIAETSAITGVNEWGY